MPAGQWVFTHEYQWLWLPYDLQYAQVIENAAQRFDYSAVAYEYAYHPAFGWHWVVAPWILRFGAVPYWGSLGPGRFAWYARPAFHLARVEGSRDDAPAGQPPTHKP